MRMVWAAGLMLLLPAGAAPLQGKPPDASSLATVVARLESFYRRSPGVVAGFTQTLDSRTLVRPQEESGIVSLKPPGRMRWEYQHPPGKLAVTDGERTYLYLPEDRQVIVGRVKDLDASSVATRLLLGTAPLAADFAIDGDPAPDREGIWLLRLSPRGEHFPYDSVVLEVEASSGAIQAIRLLDPLGNRMEYRFQQVRVDASLSDKLFTYKIPRGVDIQTLGPGERRPGSP